MLLSIGACDPDLGGLDVALPLPRVVVGVTIVLKPSCVVLVAGVSVVLTGGGTGGVGRAGCGAIPGGVGFAPDVGPTPTRKPGVRG